MSISPRSKITRWSILVFVSFLSACRTDEPVPPDGDDATKGTLRIHVVPVWEGAPFAPFTEYRAPHDYRFQVEFLRMYLGDIRLVNADGETTVDPVRLLDLNNGSFNMDLKVPPGTWYGVRAGLGLPPDLNHTAPSLYPSEHPMSVFSGMTWSMDGYKFVVFDGRYDPDPLGTGALLSPFSVHTGKDTCYTTVDLFPALPFTTKTSMITDLTLRIDVDGFLQSGNDTIDVAVENQSHFGNLPLALKLTRTVANSLHMQ